MLTRMAHAFITGAAGGIGLATVRAFSRDGFAVTATDIPASLDTVSQADKALPQCSWSSLDVTDSQAVAEAVTAAFHAGASTFVSVAGVLCAKRVDEADRSDLDRTFAVNVAGVFNVVSTVAHLVREHGAPSNCSIVTVASNAANTPRFGVSLYAASKAAASMLTRSAGLELGELGVRCNVVNPGSTGTPMLTHVFDADRDELTDAERASLVEGNPQAYKMGIPLKRVGQPENVAEAVVWLASEGASQVTLTELAVDGGASLR